MKSNTKKFADFLNEGKTDHTTKSSDNKKEKVSKLAKDMLQDSYNAMLKKVEKALNSGAINIDDWDEKTNPMVLPKSIVIAILQDESTQYDGKGTSFEKEIKKNVSNIKHFL